MVRIFPKANVQAKNITLKGTLFRQGKWVLLWETRYLTYLANYLSFPDPKSECSSDVQFIQTNRNITPSHNERTAFLLCLSQHEFLSSKRVFLKNKKNKKKLLFPFPSNLLFIWYSSPSKTRGNFRKTILKGEGSTHLLFLLNESAFHKEDTHLGTME